MLVNYIKISQELHERIALISTIKSINIYKFVVRTNKLTFIAFDALMKIVTADLNIESKVAAICNQVALKHHAVIFPILLVKKPGSNKEVFRPIRELTELTTL